MSPHALTLMYFLLSSPNHSEKTSLVEVSTSSLKRVHVPNSHFKLQIVFLLTHDATDDITMLELDPTTVSLTVLPVFAGALEAQ